MLRAGLATVLATATVLGVVALPAAAAPGPPSARQVRRAVALAQGSKLLWATVNICQSRTGHGGELGVRGEMPTLGFPATLAMTIQVNLFSPGHRRFIALPSSTAKTTLPVGTFTTGLQQDGAVFPFKAQAGLLDATVTFTWTRAGRVLGRAQRTTTAGHHGVDFSRPAKFSAAQCRIG